MKNKWQKCKNPYVEELEFFEIYENEKFLTSITIERQCDEYYCVYNNGKNRWTLNNYPFSTIKQCKDFIQNYLEDIKKIAKDHNRLINRICKFSTLQEEGKIPMKE